MKKKVLLACALCVVLLASVLLVNTFRFTSRQVQVEAVQAVAVDQDGAAGRLADTIRFQTVSYQDPTKVNGDAFLALHRYLERTFPRIHAALTRETRRRLQPALHLEGTRRPVEASSLDGSSGRRAGRPRDLGGLGAASIRGTHHRRVRVGQRLAGRQVQPAGPHGSRRDALGCGASSRNGRSTSRSATTKRSAATGGPRRLRSS